MTTGDSTANKEFKKEIIETHSAQETFALGQRIGLEALPGQVYTLIGDLGVGKTVFTQGVADGLGIEEYVMGEGVSLIEWANLIEEILPEHYRQVTIEKDLEKGFDYRRITIEEMTTV